MFWIKLLASKQALLGALSVGWRKEGELATMSLEFEYLCRKVNVKCWLAEMTLAMMSLPLACVFQCLFSFALVSTLCWLAEIWQLSWLGATRELEVEFKFRWRSCKFYFLFHPCHLSAPESLLAGYKVAGPCSLWHIPKPMITLFSFVKHVFKFYSWNFLWTFYCCCSVVAKK